MNRGLRPALASRLIPLLALVLVVGARAVAVADVSGALEQRGIRDARVLAAFEAVSRGTFTAGGESPPADVVVLARLIEALDVGSETRALVVGGTSAYPAAVVAQLAARVAVVLPTRESAQAGRLRLTEAGYRNVHVRQGDPAKGWREYGPYDAVLVATPMAGIHQTLIEQMREGAVLTIAIREASGRQSLLRGVKRGFKIRARELGPASAGPPVVVRPERREAPPPPPRPVPPAIREEDLLDPDALERRRSVAPPPGPRDLED